MLHKGLISLWSASDKSQKEGLVHRSNVSLLQWNTAGNRLISSDRDGHTIVWKVDIRGRLTVLCQYRMPLPVKFCLFRTSV